MAVKRQLGAIMAAAMAFSAMASPLAFAEQVQETAAVDVLEDMPEELAVAEDEDIQGEAVLTEAEPGEDGAEDAQFAIIEEEPGEADVELLDGLAQEEATEAWLVAEEADAALELKAEEGEETEEGIPVDEEHFPDAHFRAYVKEAYGDVLTQKEIDSCKYMSISSKEIAALKGIEYFTELESLYCDYNKLTELPLSALTELKQLKCQGNRLTSLQLTDLTNLQILRCSNNRLTELDVSGLPALQELSCESNELTKLKVEGLTNLTSIDCSTNKLNKLDLTGLTNLQTLYCSKNNLTELNMSGLAALQKLYTFSNKLNKLDLSGLTGMKRVDCSDNGLTELKVSGAIALQDIEANRNKLTKLDLSGLTSLQSVNCSDNSLTELKVSGATDLQELSCDNNQLKTLDLTGLNELTNVSCGNNVLTDLLLTGCENLSELHCRNNSLVTLDVSGLGKLKTVYGSYNKLTTVRLTGCAGLQELSVYSNTQLSALDVSGCTELQQLECSNCALGSLDVSQNSALTRLDCRENQLTSLLLPSGADLSNITCYNNQLVSLDISGCTGLKRLSCSNNALTKLDVSRNALLTDLYCSNNQILDLKLSDAGNYVSLSLNTQYFDLPISIQTTEDTICWLVDITSIKANTVLVDMLCSAYKLEKVSEDQLKFTEENGRYGNHEVEVPLGQTYTTRNSDEGISTLEYRVRWDNAECKHEKDLVWVITEKPTYKEEGRKVGYCPDCGGSRDSDYVPVIAHDHVYGNWTVTEPATCSRFGERERTCTLCGDEDYESIPNTGHTIQVTKREATVFQDGMEEGKCTRCGDIVYASSVSKLPAYITMNVGAKSSVPLKMKQKNSAIKVTGLAEGDSIASVVSSNKKIAAASISGNVIKLKAGKKKGKATITVSSKAGAVYTFTVKVQSGKVKAKKLLVKNLTLKAGEKVNLRDYVSPLTTQDKLSCTSAKKNIASVTKAGVITAKKNGSAVITVKLGSKKAKVKVTVE